MIGGAPALATFPVAAPYSQLPEHELRRPLPRLARPVWSWSSAWVDVTLCFWETPPLRPGLG